MPNAFPVRARNIIFCEDIRQEMQGKFSALGIYAGDIVPKEMGGHIKMALYIEMFPTVLGKFHLEVTLSFEGEILMRGEVQVEAKNVRDPAVIVTPTFPVALLRPGMLKVHLEFEGRRKLIADKEIRPPNPALAAYATGPVLLAEQPPSARRKKAKQP